MLHSLSYPGWTDCSCRVGVHDMLFCCLLIRKRPFAMPVIKIANLSCTHPIKPIFLRKLQNFISTTERDKLELCMSAEI